MDRGHASGQESPHRQGLISQMQSISNKRAITAHIRNECPRHKQKTSPARPLTRLSSSRITAKRFRRSITESVFLFSDLLPLTHLRRKLTTGRAMSYRMPHQMPCFIYSALRRARTPRLRNQRRRDQPWPNPRACATAARRECPAQSRGSRISRLRP